MSKEDSNIVRGDSMNKHIKVLVSDLAFKESREVILPHAYGTLRAYQQHHYPHLSEHLTWLPPLFEWDQIEKICFDDVHLLALSCYVWNIQTQMKIAELFKSQNHQGLVICGGPQIPMNGGDYKNKHPYVDIWIYKEGEECFAQAVESLIKNGFEETIQKRIQLEQPQQPKLNEQSPYTMKLYDPIISKSPNRNYTAMWESTRGCPFNCSFCNWGSYTSSNVRMIPQERIEQELEWLEKSQVSNLYITDANFGILPRDVEIAKKLALIKKKSGNPKQVWANYNKNTNHRVLEINDIFVKNSMSYTGATISVQSLSTKVLENIGRENIGFNKYLKLDAQQQKNDITSYTELILGLPGETHSSFMSGINTLVAQKIRNIRMYPALALKNTDFDNVSYREKFGIKTQAKKIYLDQHWIGSNEIIERADVITETNSMSHEDIRIMYKLAYLTQGLYSTGILKIIFDQLISEHMNFCDFIHELQNFQDPFFNELFSFLDLIIHNQFETDLTSMFGAQFVSYRFKNTDSNIRAAPWNLIWLKVILDKSTFYASLKKYIKSKFSISDLELDQVFKLQDFLLMDIELWEKGEKRAHFPTDFLHKHGISTKSGNIIYKEKIKDRGSHLFDYLMYSTGSTVITEYKFLIQKREIEDVELVNSAPL